MNLARILSAVLLLAAGQSAHAQARLALPGVASTPGATSHAPTTLSTNYRLTLAAKSGDKTLGTISLLTCSPSIDASGFLDQPADETLPASTLTLRGTMTEQEGGALLLTYSFGVSSPVVTQTTVSSADASAKRPAADAHAGDAKAAADSKPEPRANVSRSISFRDHFTTGALRVKPGSAYELVTMAGVVYSLTLAPEPQK